MLKFVNPYLSITPFDDIDIPSLTVITGKNGSGKSHLLSAILARNVVFTNLVNPKIISFNYEIFKLDNETTFSSQNIIVVKHNAWAFFESTIKQHLINWKGVLQPQDQAEIANAPESVTPIWQLPETPSLLRYKNNVENLLKNPQVGNQVIGQALLQLIRTLPYTLDMISRDEFLDVYRQYELKDDFLPKTLGKVFWDYHYKLEKNEYSRWKKREGMSHAPSLSADDFTAKFGEAPWKIVNRIMSDVSGLDYEVLSPETLGVYDDYRLQLVSKENPNLRIEFSNLSSGERVLMALVASIYSNSEFEKPNVLLLDELDASLHPSMIKSLLRVLQEEFVSKETQVLLVTHSPTTVALAPEGSVFIMHRSGTNRLEKSNRKDALTLLTEGFVTLDEGIVIIRELFDNPLTIITEGRNVAFIEQYLNLRGIEGVKIITGLEAKTGSAQMKTVFHFMQSVPHTSKVLFVWDSDVEPELGKQLTSKNNTIPFFFPKNLANQLAQRGIGNLFTERLMADMTIKTLNPGGSIRSETFSRDYKGRFESRVLSRANLEDYVMFESLYLKVISLQNTYTN